jgi:carbon-monoxide dehydrogenase large subunit
LEGWIGRPVRRREDRDLLTGRGRFAADPAPPGLVHVAFRRAGAPAGAGLRVDVGPALSMPGVVGAWRAGELGLADEHMPHLGPPPPARRPVLAGGRVRFEGEAVAVVAAESEYQAADAADAVVVELDPEPPEEAATVDTRHAFGDAAAAFSGALVTVRARLGMARIAGGAIEPRACLARWHEAEGRLEIRATVGWVHGLRDAVAGCLGLEKERVVALTQDVGGSFGAKNGPYPEYVAAAAVSRRLGRPVRWTASRIDDMHTTAQAHGASLDLEVAADADGRLRGVRGRIDWPVGAYVTGAVMMSHAFATHMVSAYVLPAMDLAVNGRTTASPPAGFIRGGGRPVGNYGIERMLDRLARRLGLDPVEVRRRNLVPASAMPYAAGFEGQVYDGGDYAHLLELATRRAGHADVRGRQRAGEPVGLGVAMCVESTGIGMPEQSRVIVQADGTAEVLAGSTPQGQGHLTFLAQVAADRLGWPLDRVTVRAGDSRNVPFSLVTAGSRSAVEVGNSVALSAAEARRLAVERAAEALEAAPDDIVLTPEGAGVRGAPGRSVTLGDVVGGGLEASATFDPSGAPAWASSCHVAVVRLDLETGGVEMLRYVIAHDSGRAINPLLVEGQLHGGYAHGLGYGLLEEVAYSEEGFLRSASFLDYAIASPPELAAEPELIHTETASSHNPEGFRGVGEAGTIAVPAAIANAVEDALRAAGHDVSVDTVPVTPLRLWRLLAENQASLK